MTVVYTILKLGGKKIGLKERTYMQEAVSAPTLSGMGKLTSTILIGTLIFEGLGAFVLCFRFVPDYGWGEGIWMAIFTSVSAFCNAGFDLMGDKTGKFSSMTAYSGDPIVCLTIPLLIIIGGLGFFVWQDIKDNRFRFRKYELHTKLVLIMTAILVIVPTVIIAIAENDLPWQERILSSFFTAVTPRTAGFNVLPLAGAGSVKSVTLLLTIVLMFIGGSSGSTAGGVKTNTIAVLGLSVFSLIRGKRSVECFGRRLDETNVKNAAQFVTAFLTLIVVGSILLCMFEQNNHVWPDNPEIAGITVTESVFEPLAWKAYSNDYDFLHWILPEELFDSVREKINSCSDSQGALLSIMAGNYPYEWKNEFCRIIQRYGSRRFLEVSRTALDNESVFFEGQKLLFQIMGKEGKRLQDCYYNVAGKIRRSPYIGLTMFTIYSLLGSDGFEKLIPSPSNADRLFYPL